MDFAAAVHYQSHVLEIDTALSHVLVDVTIIGSEKPSSDLLQMLLPSPGLLISIYIVSMWRKQTPFTRFWLCMKIIFCIIMATAIARCCRRRALTATPF